MNYSVDWEDDALAALAAIWTGSPRRRRLRRRKRRSTACSPPTRCARPSLVEGLYAITVPPLHAQFEIVQAKRSVKVVSVGQLA